MATDSSFDDVPRERLDLLDVALFVRAAALANVSSAGREFGLSAAAASARLAHLERMLGARLLHRTTRRVSVTQEGEVFAEHARALLDAADAARASVGRALAEPYGRLRVTMPSSLGRQHVSPLIPAFLRQYPGVSVDLRLTDQVVDLVDEGIDLAIRIGALKDSTLVARKLATNRRVLCASPAYLEAHGTPRHPADLVHHECVILSDQRDWGFVTPTGVINVRVSGRLASDNGEVIRDALAAGFGIGLKSTWSVAPLLSAGELVTLLDDYPLSETVAIWAVYPSRAFVPPKTLAFIDFLIARFGEPPYWDVEPSQVMR
ncbi:Transcriptional regulator, LysR family [Caballeronia glathei]|jgi:DNA-binding transcriptional LysR family regulator|uniref:LysR family transcriptional regulator n=1 Tax=Caballeronia glathei TaxID=60547 RepID=A0A069PF61_9BURK|nr:MULTISPECIES: LysR family transcriptional regulator [Burkholderiaceae]KDR39132.1 LysR family transcriptional regulator [Caballeronia glathei]TCK43811.1 LysR family transcriptional regulator [Paraburkholderia sp. BL8N3]CDY75542.1 Transcriptional regulator, LysR family [Caballeronia glathei]